MIKQTRGAIRFLLADYRAVLKYAMIAATGIALASSSYADNVVVGGSKGKQQKASEKISGEISVDEVSKYQNTDLLKNKVVIGIKDEITGGPHTWGAARLDNGKDLLLLGLNGVVTLAGAAYNGGYFVSKFDGSVANVELAPDSVLTLEGNGSVGDVKGDLRR